MGTWSTSILSSVTTVVRLNLTPQYRANTNCSAVFEVSSADSHERWTQSKLHVPDIFKAIKLKVGLIFQVGRLRESR